MGGGGVEQGRGRYWQGVGIRHAEVYDWTLWQMLDLVTAATNTALNPRSCLTPPRPQPPLTPCLRSLGGRWRNSQRPAVRETNETGNNGRLGCLTFYQIPPLFHSSGRSPDRLGGKPASLPACLPACLPLLVVLAAWSGPAFSSLAVFC